MRNVRLALCQIECHPAIYSSHISYLEEPFVPNNISSSLSILSTRVYKLMIFNPIAFRNIIYGLCQDFNVFLRNYPS